MLGGYVRFAGGVLDTPEGMIISSAEKNLELARHVFDSEENARKVKDVVRKTCESP
jgi:hypothetical protein